MAALVAMLVEKVFDDAERQWEADLEYHRLADDIGAGL